MRISPRPLFALLLLSIALLVAPVRGALANTVSPGPAPSCISTVNPCIVVPVQITRTDAIGIRGYSVTIQLSAELTLCGAGITSGGYLANPDFHVLDNGGGSYTIDEATLGLPCGATANGTLFNVRVASATPTGTGTITVSTVLLRDCSNGAVAATAGPAATITIDNVAPSVLTLSAAQKKLGNVQPPNGTTDVLVSWSGQEAGSTVQVFRKGFGGYPQYDEAGGVAPTAPATPAAALSGGWTATGVTTSGGADRTGARDFYYYVAFVTDACGNVSAVSNRTNGTLNYHLGDVHDGASACAGDDLVNTSDVSLFGANYGATIPLSGALECLDVGPTSDFSVDGLPTTDNKVQFEDLIMYAINFGQVSMPQARMAPVAAAVDRIALRVPATPRAGETFDVALEFAGTGAVQGLSAQLAWDAAVVEPIGVEGAALLSAQAAPGLALSARAGSVDVALLGRDAGLRGTGDLARVRFRVLRGGDPRIELAAADARDVANRRLALDQPLPVSTAAPARSGLSAAMPTPFRDRTVLECALARDGEITLGIYGIDGRRIRTLARGSAPAGVHRFSWDGRDDAGREVAAGMFFARLDTGEGRFRRTLIRVK